MIAACQTPTAETESISERIDREMHERFKIDGREDLSFEISAYKFGIECTGYFELEDVPTWISQLAREVWLYLEDQERAERFLRRLTKADLPSVDCAASMPLYRDFIRRTLRTAEPLVADHAELMTLLHLASDVLRDGVPDDDRWDTIHDRAVEVIKAEPRGSTPRRVAKALVCASLQDASTPLRVWQDLEKALGFGEFQEPGGYYRRTLPRLQLLSRDVFRIIRESLEPQAVQPVESAAA